MQLVAVINIMLTNLSNDGDFFRNSDRLERVLDGLFIDVPNVKISESKLFTGDTS